jgi:hypothetical protein
MLRFRLIACGIFGLFAAVFPARAQLAMENGFLLPPYDTLYALVVFAEVDYSERCPGNLGEPWISDWVQGPGGTLPPPQAPQLFSSAPDLENPGLVTMFYEQASFGRYQLLGDYLPEVFRVPCHRLSPRDYGILPVLEQVNRFLGHRGWQTAHGLPASAFDQWTTSAPGQPKRKDSDGKVDLLYVIWKNNRYLHGLSTLDHSGYGVTAYRSPGFGPFDGLNSAASFNQGKGLGHSLHVLVCEHLHGLFGGNHWHSGGGAGTHCLPIPPANYGLTGQMNSSMISFAAWDRWMMDWKSPQKEFLISALDSLGQEINTEDLLAEEGPDRQVFWLRDFRTTGDALRIRLPYLNSDSGKAKVKNQYLWLEYRSMDHPTEEYLSPQHDCALRPDAELKQGSPGVYAYLQIGKDQRWGGSELYAERADLPNSLGSFLFPLPADGRWDFAFRSDLNPKPHGGACSWGNAAIPIDRSRSLPNPFTGLHDLYLAYDANGDGSLLGKEDLMPGLAEAEGDSVLWNYRKGGDGFDAFGSYSGNTELSLSTNPAPVPVYTQTTHYESAWAGDPNAAHENRTIHLNGLRIRIEDDPKQKQARIVLERRFYQLHGALRWCGHIVLHGETQPKLRLKKGCRLRLENGESPVLAKARGNPPSLLQPTVFELRPGSSLILEKGSKLFLGPGTELRLHPGSSIVKRGGKMRVHKKAKWGYVR